MTEPSDAFKELVGGLRPHERLGVPVGDLYVPSDGRLQLPRAAMHTSAQLLLGQRREPALDEIDPRGAGWREGQVEARMARQPSDPSFLVNGRPSRAIRGLDARFMEVWCSSRPHVRDPENLVAPGLHLLPRSAVICALAPRISARRRALEGTLDIDDSELSSLRCGCVARLATSLAPDAAPDPLDPRGAPRRRYPRGDEGDADESAPRAGEDPARGVDELMWQDEEGRRRMRLTFAVVAISALMMIGLPVASHGDPLPFESIDVPHAAPTVPNGINSKGQIVGLFRDATGTHGFLLTKGQLVTIDVIPGASDTEAYGLNGKGDIVGKILDSSGEHGFLRARGTITSIAIPGAFLTNAFGINNREQIVGHFRDASGNDGFLLSAAGFTRISVKGAILTAAFGINDHGDIVGLFTDGGPFRGFLLSQGRLFTIDVPGASNTTPLSINNAGEIAGIFQDHAGTHGFLLTHDSFVTIDIPGASSTQATGINDGGQIVGTFEGSLGQHGFLI